MGYVKIDGAVVSFSPAQYGPAAASIPPTAAVPCLPIVADRPLQNGAAISSSVAVVKRGVVTFFEKIRRAQASGAVAVVVINTSDDALALVTDGGQGDIKIPSVSISCTDGEMLLAIPGATIEIGFDLVADRQCAIERAAQQAKTVPALRFSGFQAMILPPQSQHVWRMFGAAAFVIDAEAPTLNGFPHYRNVMGGHLYVNSAGNWAFNSDATPAYSWGQAYRSMDVNTPDSGPVEIGCRTWKAFHGAAWHDLEVAAAEVSADELEAEVQHRHDAHAEGVAEALSQCERLAALRIELDSATWHPEDVLGCYRAPFTRDPAQPTYCDRPHYSNGSAHLFYSFLHEGWVIRIHGSMDGRPDPRPGTDEANILAGGSRIKTAGQVPLGDMVWGNQEGTGADKLVRITVSECAEAELRGLRAAMAAQDEAEALDQQGAWEAELQGQRASQLQVSAVPGRAELTAGAFERDAAVPAANGRPHWSNGNAHLSYSKVDSSWIMSTAFPPDQSSRVAALASRGALAVGKAVWQHLGVEDSADLELSVQELRHATKPGAADDVSAETAEVEGSAAVAASQWPAFPEEGIQVGVLEWLIRNDPRITADMTTSDVCHTVVKPMTVPAGWSDVPTLINPQKGWFAHKYVSLTTGEEKDDAPLGTRSLAKLLLESEDPTLRGLIGRANVFFSHAWSAKFMEVVQTMKEFVATRPPGSATVFFWFDVCSVDEHATQSLPQEWWSTTFKDAIRSIGYTAIMLSPWQQPVTLTRAWCLWEIYCTLEVGAGFATCFGGDERRKFEHTVSTEWSAVDRAFAQIDVANAEAGSPDDLDMIMKAVDASGGPVRLNTLVMKHMREWVIRMAVWTINKSTNPDGGIYPSSMGPALNVATLLHSRNLFDSAMRLYQQTFDAAAAVVVPGQWDRPARWMQMASTAMGQVHFFRGENDAARARYEQDIEAKTAFLGPKNPEVLQTQCLLAMTLDKDQKYTEAKELYEHVISGLQALGGAGGQFHVQILRARANYGITLLNMKDFVAAHQNGKLLLEGRLRAFGPNHVDTLVALADYGKILMHLGEFPDARRELETALEGLVVQLGPAHSMVFTHKMNLAKILDKVGETAKAVKMYRATIDLWKERVQAGEGDPRDISSALKQFADCLAEHGDVDECMGVQQELELLSISAP
jgi:tetratricopeptide (TPR) repeat protein